MKLNQLQDAIRRFYDLYPDYAISGVGEIVHLTQSVEGLLDQRLGRIYSMRSQVAAAAAKYQSISLQLPAGGLGVDVEILEVHIRNLAGSYVLYGAGTSTTSTDRGAGYCHDLREIPRAYRSVARLRDDDDAGVMLIAQGEIQNATQAWKPEGGLFLAPGQMWTFRTSAVNQGITGMITWRETPIVQNP